MCLTQTEHEPCSEEVNAQWGIQRKYQWPIEMSALPTDKENK